MRTGHDSPFAKPTFGSAALCEYVRTLAEEKGAADGKGFCVELCGVCTDICVVSNALLLKAAACRRRISS